MMKYTSEYLHAMKSIVDMALTKEVGLKDSCCDRNDGTHSDHSRLDGYAPTFKRNT